MARPATGYIKWRRNAKSGVVHWHAQVTLKDGSRPWVPLDPSIPEADRPAALECAKQVSDEARAQGFVPETIRETVSEYAKRWHAWRDTRGLQCVKDDRARMTNHVLDVIGPLDVRAVTRTDLERLVEHLDKRIAKGDLGWKVAGMAWNNVTRMFKDACSAKKLDLRVREDDPTEGIQAPERGAKKEKQYLWPTEFLTLVSCERVPVRWRVLFALAVYTYSRAGELAALRWDDVSFETMIIHIHTSMDRVRKRGTIKSTKTGVSRRIPIEAELVPLLRRLHSEAGGKGRVVAKMPSPGMLSRKLKVYLARAEVKRSELFASDATRKAITFHDLRATGLTWMAARGDDPLRIKQRAGHASFSTTEGYIREAENLGASFGQVFPPLPDLHRGFATVPQFAKRGAEFPKDSATYQWAQQGLNPSPRAPESLADTPTSATPPETADRETTRAHVDSPAGSRPVASGDAKLTVDVLRRKLDAAIVAEEWGAVKAVRERLSRAEREEAGNVVPFDAGRRGGR